MGLSVVAAKGLRRLNAQLGTEFVHASLFSDGHQGLGVGSDLNVYQFDRRSREVEKYDGLTTTAADARCVVWALSGGS